MKTATPQMLLETVAAGPARRPFISLEFLIRAFDRVYAWQVRAAERRRLMTLDDRMLSDIGLDRGAAIEEGSKPFWRD